MYRINCESIGDVKKYIWYYRKDNKENGPFTYEDIVKMVSEGVIGPDDYVLKFGNRKFMKVSEVEGLSEIQPSPEGQVSSETEENIENNEKAEEAKEKQHEEIKEAVPEIKKEKIKEDYYIAHDNRGRYIQGKHKKESFGQKIALIIACVVGLCFIAVLWILLS